MPGMILPGQHIHSGCRRLQMLHTITRPGLHLSGSFHFMRPKTLPGFLLFATGIYLLATPGPELMRFLLGIAVLAIGFFILVNAAKERKAERRRAHSARQATSRAKTRRRDQASAGDGGGSTYPDEAAPDSDGAGNGGDGGGDGGGGSGD